MSQAEPLKATYGRDEIEKRINKSLEENDGEIQRPTINNTRMTVEDCIYDELRNIHGTVAGNQVALESIDERLCETNDLLWRIVNKDTHKTTECVKDYYNNKSKEVKGITKEDIDDYMDSVKDYYVFDDKGNCKENTMSSKTKKVNLKSRERYLIYKALGSRISTMRNQIGYSRVDEDKSLKDQINKAENLMEKIKNS